MNTIIFILIALCVILCFFISYWFIIINKFKKDRQIFIEISNLLHDVIEQNSKVIVHTNEVINITKVINKENTDLINILTKDYTKLIDILTNN